ncbi:MAG TPA: DUF222 domain-containing protein [Microbacteriaceae bacterium]|nr:DUF222 domain-containing protein [Microbacteriaceae bacterium]
MFKEDQGSTAQLQHLSAEPSTAAPLHAQLLKSLRRQFEAPFETSAVGCITDAHLVELATQLEEIGRFIDYARVKFAGEIDARHNASSKQNDQNNHNALSNTNSANLSIDDSSLNVYESANGGTTPDPTNPSSSAFSGSPASATNPASSISGMHGCRNSIELLQKITNASTATINSRLRLAKEIKPYIHSSGQTQRAKFETVAAGLKAGLLNIDTATTIVKKLSTLPTEVKEHDIKIAETHLVASAVGAAVPTESMPDLNSFENEKDKEKDKDIEEDIDVSESLSTTPASEWLKHRPHLAEHADKIRIVSEVWANKLKQQVTKQATEDQTLERRFFTIGKTRNGLVPISGLILPEIAAGLGTIIHAVTSPRAKTNRARKHEPVHSAVAELKKSPHEESQHKKPQSKTARPEIAESETAESETAQFELPLRVSDQKSSHRNTSVRFKSETEIKNKTYYKTPVNENTTDETTTDEITTDEGLSLDALISDTLNKETFANETLVNDTLINNTRNNSTGTDASTLDATTLDTTAPDITYPETNLISDRRSASQKRHDALATLIQAAAKSADTPNLGGAPVTVLIEVKEETLKTASSENNAGFGLLHSHDGEVTPISLNAVSHAGCTGTTQKIVTNGNGKIVSIGTPERIFNTNQRKAITLRDRGCVIPGCTVPAAWCEIHHVIEHSKGGETHTDNGVMLCYWHHRNLDRNGWNIKMIDGAPWVRPPKWIDPQRRWHKSRRQAEIKAANQLPIPTIPSQTIPTIPSRKRA